MLVTAIVTGIIFILTCLSVAGVITFTDNKNIGIFLCIIFGAFCVVQVLCLISTKPSLKKAGFYIFHIGMLVFLFSCFMFFASGEKITVSGVQVGNIAYNKIKSTQGDDIELGFGLQAKKFDVLKYPAASNGAAADKFLNAQLVIYPDGDNPYEKNLYVNGPVTVNGWKIYLMAYNSSPDGTDTLTLTFKKNPGEIPTIAGIILMVVGSFMMAFVKKGQSPKAKKKGGGKHE